MTNKIIECLFLLTFLVGCNPSKVSLVADPCAKNTEGAVVPNQTALLTSGTWQIIQRLDDGVDVTNETNAAGYSYKFDTNCKMIAVLPDGTPVNHSWN